MGAATSAFQPSVYSTGLQPLSPYTHAWGQGGASYGFVGLSAAALTGAFIVRQIPRVLLLTSIGLGISRLRKHKQDAEREETA
jgi:hypothetical protein